MLHAPCKPPISAAPRRRASAAAGALLVAACALAGCAPPGRSFRVHELEEARAVLPHTLARLVASRPDRVAARGQALSPRLTLVQVRSAAEWRRLAKAEPRLGAPPDFSRGIAVGLLARTGTPLGAGRPIEIESVHVREGAGLLRAHFEGGTFLVDDTSYLALVFVEGLAAVLIVDVDGTRYFPE